MKHLYNFPHDKWVYLTFVPADGESYVHSDLLPVEIEEAKVLKKLKMNVKLSTLHLL